MTDTIWYTPTDCSTCLVDPLLFARNAVDGRLALYCYSCGGLYRTPDGLAFAYGDVPVDKSKLRAATLAEITAAGYGPSARVVQGPVYF